jgi:hypothetical protein
MGPQGLMGPAGPAGNGGLSGWMVVSRAITIPSDQSTQRIDCPAGKRVLSGGYAYDPDGSSPGWAYASFPSGSASWTVSFHNQRIVARTGTIYAICADAS